MTEPVRNEDAAAGFLDREAAKRFVEDATFRAAGAAAFRIGVEAELIPVHHDTHTIPSVADELVPAIRALATDEDWKPVRSAKGAPLFELPAGGRLTFEPGGQIEYAAPPFESPSAALANLRRVLGRLRDCLAEAGIELYGLGVDPFNGPAGVPLQVDTDRYRSMDTYYATFGPAGARMMRQTAALQVNVDSRNDPRLIWQVLNALAPVLVATFANSRRWAGRETRFANFRSRTWQVLDRTRTGMPWAPDQPELHYAEFALDAPFMFRRAENGDYRPFRHWIERGVATPASLASHLSTLFPEVRPRHYFEVRSVDALPIAMYAAPIMLISGLTLDAGAAHAAAEVLRPPDTTWLRRAARHGLGDETLHDRAIETARLAIAACRKRPDVCFPDDVDTAERFFQDFTRRGRSPADAVDALKSAATAA